MCTVFAHNGGGFWELNPFAGELIHSMSMISTFKITLTIGAAFLLITTRKHRPAQIASWWAGVLYTFLIIRWVTFNSMFM